MCGYFDKQPDYLPAGHATCHVRACQDLHVHPPSPQLTKPSSSLLLLLLLLLLLQVYLPPSLLMPRQAGGSAFDLVAYVNTALPGVVGVVGLVGVGGCEAESMGRGWEGGLAACQGRRQQQLTGSSNSSIQQEAAAT
jgi:hypothetical protein